MELINERNEINNKKFEYESELSKLKEELENQIEKNNDLIKELENYKQINKKMVEENNKKQNYEKEIENLKSTLSKSQRKGMSDNTYLYKKISKLEDKIIELEKKKY